MKDQLQSRCTFTKRRVGTHLKIKQSKPLKLAQNKELGKETGGGKDKKSLALQKRWKRIKTCKPFNLELQKLKLKEFTIHENLQVTK